MRPPRLRNLRKLRKFVGRAGVVAGALLLAACSSDKGPKPAKLTAIAHPISIQQSWVVEVGSAGRVGDAYLRPCVLPQAVYAASASGDLVRVDPTNGKTVWRVHVPGGIADGVGCNGIDEAVADPRGGLRLYDAAGKFRWKTDEATSVAVTPPLLGHSLVVVRTIDQRVTAYNEDHGTRVWSFRKTPPPLSLRGESEMALAGDLVIIGFPRGKLDAVALANGAPRWEAAVSEPKGVTEVERLNDVLGMPAVDGADVCADSYQGRVSCFDTYTGELRWVRKFDAGAGVAIDPDLVIAVRENGDVDALSRDAGAGMWRNGALSYRGLTAPAILGQWAVVGDYVGDVHFLRLQDGQIVGRFVAGSPLASVPQAWNDGLVLQTVAGKLFLLTPH